MRKTICMVWVALMFFLPSVIDIGDALDIWTLDKEGTSGRHAFKGTLINHNFTPTKNIYVFRGNGRRLDPEIAYPLVYFEVSASWDLETKTAKESIRLGDGREGTTVASCAVDPWLNETRCYGVSIQGDAFSDYMVQEQADRVPLTPQLLTSAQKNDLRAERDWLNSQVEIVNPTPNYSFPSPDRVVFIARVKSDLPVPNNAVMMFRIEEIRWPTSGQPQKAYEKSQKILQSGYANLPFKEISPGKWFVVARIQGGSTSGASPRTPFEVGGSPAPTNLKAGLTGIVVCETRNVKLKWEAYALGQKGFAIERKMVIPVPAKPSIFLQIATVDGNKREYVDTSPKLGGDYNYRVKALLGQGESAYSNEAKIVLENVHKPKAPTNLRSVSGSQVNVNAPIKLSWKDNSDDEAGFAIERKDPGSNKFRKLFTTVPNVQEWTDTTPKPAGFYTYHIRAISKGCSSHSNTISVQVGTPASAPKDMRKMRKIN